MSGSTSGQSPTEGFRSGFVSILGRPNAGKSTLLNALIGGKLAIVSDKPQTTRTSIEGVLNLDNAQIVFVDTPGIHKSTTLLNQRMMGTVRAAVEDRREFQQRRAAGQTPLRGKQGDGARHLHAGLADIDERKTNTPEACR